VFISKREDLEKGLVRNEKKFQKNKKGLFYKPFSIVI
jgi:hypothetical protein